MVLKTGDLFHLDIDEVQLLNLLLKDLEEVKETNELVVNLDNFHAGAVLALRARVHAYITLWQAKQG